jgi:hypothetical protein
MSEPEDDVQLQIIRREGSRATMTHYMLIAQQVIAVLNRLMDEIPGFREAGNVSRDFIRRKAGVPRPFVRDAVAVLQVHDKLEFLRQQDGRAALDNQQWLDAFVAVKKLLGVFYRGMVHTAQWKEAQLASSAQKILKFVEAMELDADDVTLTHVRKHLQRARRRPRRKKKTQP